MAGFGQSQALLLFLFLVDSRLSLCNKMWLALVAATCTLATDLLLAMILMNTWQRALLAPQTLWFRKLLFQIHLWLGIGFGFYVLLISLSGSALLLKSPFYSWFEPKNINPPADAVMMTDDEIARKAAEVYAGYEIGYTFPSPLGERNHATYIVLNKDGKIYSHYFNQFTGEDLGITNPWPVKTVEWLANVHAELTLGRRLGRQVNGVGGLLFVLMSLSGLVLWWQGRARWYEGFVILPKSKRGLMWQLHSFLGFWSLLLMLAWGVSGFQLGFPVIVDHLVDWLDNDLTDGHRPNSWLHFFRSVHFARFGETALTRWLWILASFLPTLILVSGVVVWWKRVVLKRVKRTSPG